MNVKQLKEECKKLNIKGYSKKNKSDLLKLLEINTKNTNNKSIIQKPFLKWVGGKTQIINSIIDKFPKIINNYHELFLGGGSVLFALLSLQKQNRITIKNKIYAYDINKTLINVYNDVQKNKDILFKYIEEYINTYDNIKGTIINRKSNTLEEGKTSKESYYYYLRNKFNNINKLNNENTVELSALFIFINKTCFRGVYREGPNGFNVPYGHYKTTPTVITKNDLDYISDLIKDVEFIHSSFIDSIKNVKKDDFMYLDPPYAPENSKSFVGYVADGFNLETHKLLFSEVKKLNNIKFIMSNAKVDLVTENFKDYSIEDIKARRAINSKNPGASTTEVIIYN